MTVTKIFKSKYFLVTMCIFIVFAAWGTLVFHVEDNSDGTHFFAVNLLSFFVEIPPDSLNKKRPPEFVPWFNYSSAVYENSFNYFLNTMCIKNGVIFNIVLTLGQAIKKAFSENDRIVCHLRIWYHYYKSNI